MKTVDITIKNGSKPTDWDSIETALKLHRDVRDMPGALSSVIARTVFYTLFATLTVSGTHLLFTGYKAGGSIMLILVFGIGTLMRRHIFKDVDDSINGDALKVYRELYTYWDNSAVDIRALTELFKGCDRKGYAKLDPHPSATLLHRILSATSPGHVRSSKAVALFIARSEYTYLEDLAIFVYGDPPRHSEAAKGRCVLIHHMLTHGKPLRSRQVEFSDGYTLSDSRYDHTPPNPLELFSNPSEYISHPIPSVQTLAAYLLKEGIFFEPEEVV